MKFLSLFNSIIKQRELFYKNKDFLRAVIYFGLLFLFDYSGTMELYGQNFYRRLINMYRRTDSLTYFKKLDPFCEPVKKMISKEDVKKLQSIKVPEGNDLSVFSRKNTTTHQCCEQFSEDEKQIITDISEKVRQTYENEIGKKLYYMNTNKATIYVYHGKSSQHLWHVDPQNLNEIYNVIICFKKVGGISPLQCKDKNNNIKSIHFEEGDAAIFNGGTTVHQVPPNDDDNSERTVLSIAFTSDIKLNKDDKYSNNMCTYLEGGNNYVHMFTLFISVLLINFIITYVSGINALSYQSLLTFLVIVLIIVKYVPLYFDIGIGTGRSSSIGKNILFLIATMFGTFSTKGAILFFSYFALSDVFFNRSWVEYD